MLTKLFVDDFDNGDLYATLGYVQDKVDGSKNAEAEGSNVEYFDARMGYRFGDFDVSAFVANLNADELQTVITKVTVLD